MKRFIVITAIAACSLMSLTAIAGNGLGGSKLEKSDVTPLSISQDLKYTLLTDGFGDSLTLLDTDSGQATLISSSRNCGVYATISSDGKYVCYKRIDSSGLQTPMIFEIAKGENIALAQPTACAGTPAAANGVIAYTVGNKLFRVDASLRLLGTSDLGHHVNLLAIAPNASAIAYNNVDMQIIVKNLKNGKSRVVTNGQGDFWGPQFSPKGDKILACTADGTIVAGNATSGYATVVAKGENAGWADNATIAVSKKYGVIGKQVESTLIETVDFRGKKQKTILQEAGDVNAAVSGGNIVMSRPGSKAIQYGFVGSRGSATLSVPDVKVDKTDAPDGAGNLTVQGTVDPVYSVQNIVDGSTYKYLNNVPYLHQNNDTPDYWNGNSSCGASSALMAINYFYILPKHPITCTWPSPHTSDYGWYVPEIYTFNGHTYNIGSADPSGRTGYGGFGYITQRGWEDTKGHMRDYIIYHGPTSSVDWSPTFAKARTEIDGNKPFVLLNSLTTAGHYIVGIGYYKSQYTLIFNDPYGNKNSGSYPSDDGRSVRYDWPGYNNGYNNLNTVHCYIYCRFGQPSAPTNVTAATVSSSQIRVNWTDGSYCEQYYDVFRSTTSGSGYTKIASVGANTTSYTAGGLAANTTYYFVVQARNPSGSSANSNQASAKTSGDTTPADIIVDNNSAAFAASTNWTVGTSAADKYGTDYRFRATAAVSDQAVWTFSPTQARNYEIYAWWTQGTNRSPSAAYILPDNTSVNKSQQAGGGTWQSLGVKSLTTGSKTVKLSCWTTTGYVVVADAIKVVAR